MPADETTTIQKPNLKIFVRDLYYLDETVKSMISAGVSLSNGYFYCNSLVDWYSELMKKVGHSDEEREKHLRKEFGDEWVDDGHFLSIDERDKFLEYDL